MRESRSVASHSTLLLMTFWGRISLLVVLVSFAADQCLAVELGDESRRFKVETIATGLNNPCGLAVRPGGTKTEEVFFSESGAARVVRLNTSDPQSIQTVVEGFPTGGWALDESLQVGPLGLAFLKRTKLVVGSGGLGVGKDSLRIYDLPTELPFNATIDYSDIDYELGPIGPGARTATGEGGHFSLVVKPDVALFASSLGDPERSWLLKASISKNKAFDLQPHAATRQLYDCDHLLAATLNLEQSDLGYLLVGSCGKLGGERRDSRVAFLSPHSGRLALDLPASLKDVAALSYSPSGQLYAADLAWDDDEGGGIYRLDEKLIDGNQVCHPVLIAKAVRPTSLVFTSKTTLYVTAFGKVGEKLSGGQLLKITGVF
ncbi:MAG: hypothetical protein RH917_16580 [Lacipirellulaceae bacterium]